MVVVVRSSLSYAMNFPVTSTAMQRGVYHTSCAWRSIHCYTKAIFRYYACTFVHALASSLLREKLTRPIKINFGGDVARYAATHGSGLRQAVVHAARSLLVQLALAGAHKRSS